MSNMVDQDRAMRVLDKVPAIDTHKIGVVYIRQGQTSGKEILFNDRGSARYLQFLNDLGSMTRLKDCTSEYVVVVTSLSLSLCVCVCARARALILRLPQFPPFAWTRNQQPNPALAYLSCSYMQVAGVGGTILHKY